MPLLESCPVIPARSAYDAGRASGGFRKVEPVAFPARVDQVRKPRFGRSNPCYRGSMAAISKDIIIDAPPALVWAALRDFGHPHDAAHGFVLATQVEGDDRIVTFANGLVARERLVDIDDRARRISYASVGGRLTHHNSSLQVFADGIDRSRVVWVTDLLPNEFSATIAAMVEQGSAALKRTLERAGAASPPQI
jgi:hypothetical protein